MNRHEMLWRERRRPMASRASPSSAPASLGPRLVWRCAQHGFTGTIMGWDRDPATTACRVAPRGHHGHRGRSACRGCRSAPDPARRSGLHDSRMAGSTRAASCEPEQLVTDVGSVKRPCVNRRAAVQRPWPACVSFPGIRWRAKRSAAPNMPTASLFRDAVWLFTPCRCRPKAARRCESPRDENGAAG